MNYQHVRSGLMVTVLASALLVTSCRRNSKVETNKDTDTEMVKDHYLSEFAYTDALNIADDGATVNSGDNLGNYKTASNCATVTHDTISNPHTMTIDFGATNCLCNDGRYRRGIILVTYTGHYRDSGHVHTLTFDNYFVNDNQVLGSKSVTNMGHNAAGNLYYSIVVNGLIIRATTMDSVIWNSNRTRTWIQGESTPVRTDDVYEITGSGSGSRPNGTSYSMNITQPLVKAVSCSWIESGKIDLQPSNKPLRKIDYGNSGCDNLATVTINNVTYNITLN